MSLQRKLEARVFNSLLEVFAHMARNPTTSGVIPTLMRGVARSVLVYRRSKPKPQPSADELGREWQRLMPSRKHMPITRVDGNTAYGEIRLPCPLRGTGDTEACHRLMEYDRALIEPHGGRFVVLRSQAEPGVEHCQVALRPQHLPATDLVPAHRRARQRPRTAARPLTRMVK